MPSSTSRFVITPDGLRLHYRDDAPAGSGLSPDPAPLPVVCLPGLARTGADFAPLAEALAARGHRVLALDYRGRGLSDCDPDPARYALGTEAGDVMTVLADAGIAEAVLVGTSRGGLLAMILAATRPALVRGAVLNDVGPVLERAGLERIRGYVGKLPPPRSWDEAVETLKRTADGRFPGLSDADWRGQAERTFTERDGLFETTYDPALAHGLAALDLDTLPTLWTQFEALGSVPVLVIRGAHSDLLSPETAEAMTRRLPDCVLHVVPGQGPCALLTDDATLAAVARLVDRCTRNSEPATQVKQSP